MDENAGKNAVRTVRRVDVNRADGPSLCPPAAEVEKEENEEDIAGICVEGKTFLVLDFRGHAQRETSQAFAAILEALITKAKDGSYNHTKLLFDVAGVNEQKKEPSSGGCKPGLGELLRNELEKHLSEADKLPDTEEKEPDPQGQERE